MINQILNGVKNLPDYKKIACQVVKREVKISQEEIEKLRLGKERMEKERVRQEILSRIADNSELHISDGLIEREQNMMLDNLKQQVPQILQIGFEEYLQKINKSEKELLDSLRAEAEKRVKGFLVLRAIAEKENIQVSEEEAEREKERISRAYPNMQNLDQNELKDYTKLVIQNEKTLQMLEGLIK
jgi:trigger factor